MIARSAIAWWGRESPESSASSSPRSSAPPTPRSAGSDGEDGDSDGRSTGLATPRRSAAALAGPAVEALLTTPPEAPTERKAVVPPRHCFRQRVLTNTALRTRLGVERCGRFADAAHSYIAAGRAYDAAFVSGGGSSGATVQAAAQAKRQARDNFQRVCVDLGLGGWSSGYAREARRMRRQSTHTSSGTRRLCGRQRRSSAPPGCAPIAIRVTERCPQRPLPSTRSTLLRVASVTS